VTSAARLLFVHAHPDDESIGTGATMAKYVAEGASVTLVTCTLGEEGEVLVPELAHLAADQNDALGEHRISELGDAMALLGVTDFRFLGGPGKYRDSGMIGVPSNKREDCFWNADLLEAATDLVAIIREVRPQVVVTYDDFGGYGHPDHIQAHRVTTYAIALAENQSFKPELGETWSVAKVYWTAFPRSRIVAGIAKLKEIGDESEFATMDPDEIPFAVDDSVITTVIDGSAFTQAKFDALTAHKTQVTTDSGFFALSNNLGLEIFTEEHFRLVRGQLPATGQESDLFEGLTLV
jgi:N-acetyl-1-D-myo-inositol-2-amino-2-deoxy-alpha-D-glucopyranoside deacetylase